MQAAEGAATSFALACKDALGGALDVPGLALAPTIARVARVLSGLEQAR